MPVSYNLVRLMYVLKTEIAPVWWLYKNTVYTVYIYRKRAKNGRKTVDIVGI